MDENPTMNPDLLESYRHSGNFNPVNAVAGLVIVALLGCPFGLAYAYVLHWIPFIYVNFLLTLGYGFTFGWMMQRLLKMGRIRNLRVAVGCGVLSGLIGLYCEWSGHIHVLFEGAPWLLWPRQLFRIIPALYTQGSWSFHGTNVTGIPLTVVWLIEAGIIVGVAASLPTVFVRDTPFCEKSRCWLDEEKKVNALENFTNPEHLAALNAGDIMPLVAANPKREGASVYTRLTLKRSPHCDFFSTLRVQNVSVSLDAKGNVTEKIRNLTGELIIPASMFELIAKFEEFAPTSATVPPV